ncbi:MAG: hypothetical protein GWP08_16495 [Nitrospiraceae bacterium]|nr:hypothetical protein [Nitrospiraceae bacterium]
MKNDKLVKIAFLCVIVCLLLCLVAGVADAKEGVATGAGDKKLAGVKDVGMLSGSKETDESKSPTKLQKTMGVASVIVMIAVVKWL